MVHNYTPTYLQDSIASICKTILPLSFKKRRIPAIAAAEQRLSKQQSDNLKWQQDSYHQILNLMGLCKEGIIPEYEVSAFRTHLLETLIASSIEHEPPVVLRDKLIFLQVFRRFQKFLGFRFSGFDCEVVVRWLKEFSVENCKLREPKSSFLGFFGGFENFWVFGFPADCEVVEGVFGPENCKLRKPVFTLTVKELLYAKCISNEEYHASKRPLLQRLAVQGAEIDVRDVIVGAGKETSNDEWSVIDLKDEKCSANQNISTSKKNSKDHSMVRKVKGAASVFGFVSQGKDKKLKENEENTVHGKSTWTKEQNVRFARNENHNGLNEKENGSKSILMVESSPSACVMAEKSKDKQFRTNFQREQEEDYSHDSNDSRQNPEKEKGKSVKKHGSWCDQYGNIVLDVVRKEFKDHMREMGNSRGKAVEKHNTFDDENSHPNLFAPQHHSHCV
ncbi:hypothetical protein DH2020_039326 [Rehmannia glutinosa]|uniref:Uncharacterized protein n=1 Tax=Rehmannia glutinosa TaxID=99300 RepID=A0ABR0UWD0_REHGL